MASLYAPQASMPQPMQPWASGQGYVAACGGAQGYPGACGQSQHAQAAAQGLGPGAWPSTALGAAGAGSGFGAAARPPEPLSPPLPSRSSFRAVDEASHGAAVDASRSPSSPQQEVGQRRARHSHPSPSHGATGFRGGGGRGGGAKEGGSGDVNPFLNVPTPMTDSAQAVLNQVQRQVLRNAGITDY
mmetsp:Transcript_55204/g.156507  ORF Transcript_55204/g.156507 Transcript_55204/m.156507 type:complete len:187 (+) Transcript_55204:2-562(+)